MKIARVRYSKRVTRSHRPKMMNGYPVIDATESVSIVVEDTDIDTRKRKDPDHCPLANGWLNERNHPKGEVPIEVKVHLSRTYVRYNGYWVRYLTSPEARQELISFDKGGKFEPGEYSFLAIPVNDRTGKRRERDIKRKRKLDKRKTHENLGKRKSPYVMKNVRPIGIYA